MASFRNRSNQWQARVRRTGYPDETRSFTSRQDAEKWARSVESDIDKGQFVNVSEAKRKTLGDLISRYLVEVNPLMKGASEDTIRLKAIMRRPFAKVMGAYEPDRWLRIFTDHEVYGGKSQRSATLT